MYSRCFTTPNALERMCNLLELIKTVRDFRLEFCNLLTERSIRAGGRSFQNRVMPAYHLFFSLQCQGRYFLENHMEVLEAGKIIFVSPGFSFGREIYEQKSFAAFTLRFTLPGINPEMNLKSPFAFSITTQDMPLFSSLIKKLYSLYCLGDISLVNATINATLSEILHLLYLEFSLPGLAPSVDARISGIKEYIDNSPFERHSVEGLAKRCHISSKHFIHLFSSAYNMTPKQYLLKVKMQHAQLLLSETSLNIGDVSSMTGYTDMFTFSKQYKKVFGFPPSHCKSVSGPKTR